MHNGFYSPIQKGYKITSMSSKSKQEKNKLRQIELLKHFEGDFYQEKILPDKVLVKMWNGGTNKWQVAVFTRSSFNNYKAFQGNGNKQKFEDKIEEEKIPFERPTLETLKNKAKQNGFSF